MPKTYLTDKLLRSLRVDSGRIDYFDTAVPGLLLRVSARRKTWYLAYRSPTFRGAGGQLLQRKANLDTYPKKPLVEARQEAAQLLAQVAGGSDPFPDERERKPNERSETSSGFLAGPKLDSEPHQEQAKEAPRLKFEALATDYLERRSKVRKESWKDDRWIIHRLLIPEWGARDPETIEAREIRRFIIAVTDRGPVLANRVLSCLSQIFEWGVSRFDLPGNTTRLVKKPNGEKRRTVVLNPSEVAAIWKASAEDRSKSMGLLLQLRLLTAQRGTEVCQLNVRHLEPDGDGAWWNLPDKLTKSGRPQRVYLSPLACELLAKTKPSKEGWYLPSEKDPSVPFSPSPHMLRRIRKCSGVEDWWATDLRRTAATFMARNGVPRFIVRRVLNHADHEITAVYDLYSYDKEVKEAVLVLEKVVRAAVESPQTTSPQWAPQTSGAAFSERSADR